MVDAPIIPAAEVPATPKKSPKAKKEKKTAGKPKAKASHPPTATMVNSAIAHLKERGGSSLQAIKKYIASTYKVDAEKLAPFIRKAIKSSVASGALVQTKGKGASGSFKIAGEAGTKKSVKKPAATAAAAKPKAAVVKPAIVKKSPVKKVTKVKKSPAKKAVAAKPKSPSKAKKTVKTPTKKPKSPKAKTAKKAKASPKKK